MFRSRYWKKIDWLLLGIAAALIVTGLLVIYATSFIGNAFASPTDFWHQIIFAILGVIVCYFLMRTDYRVWRGLSSWLYAGMVLSLIIVLVASHAVLGASRWINLGFFQFQPSEFAKLVIIIVLARFFSDNYDRLRSPKYLLISILYLLLPVVLVMRQPDLGTALVLLAVWFSMVLISSVRRLHILIMVGLVLAATPFLLKMLKPFQRARLTTFLNPTADPLHTGYNAVQSTITVGSGGFFGRGLTAGTQTQLGFLPTLAQHTDFVFAALSEKMGFVGSALIIMLFLGLLLRGIQIAYKAKDRFGMFLATGIVAMLAFHVFINIGMNIGIAPVTGIPLPFVSYGGTSMIVDLAAIGLLESIAMRRKKIEFDS